MRSKITPSHLLDKVSMFCVKYEYLIYEFYDDLEARG